MGCLGPWYPALKLVAPSSPSAIAVLTTGGLNGVAHMSAPVVTVPACCKSEFSFIDRTFTLSGSVDSFFDRTFTLSGTVDSFLPNCMVPWGTDSRSESSPPSSFRLRLGIRVFLFEHSKAMSVRCCSKSSSRNVVSVVPVIPTSSKLSSFALTWSTSILLDAIAFFCHSS